MVEMPVFNGGGGSDEEPAKALQFATLQQNEIIVTEEAMEFLGSFPCDQKLSIVTIVGPINSGKSSLASRLVGASAAEQSTFPIREEGAQSLESTKNSLTSGIMMWSRPIKLKDGTLLLVLDMQGLPQPAPQTTSSMRSPRTSALRSPRGLSALQKGHPTDRLLAFATLVSSLVVYTQNGSNLQDQMIECLEPIAKFSDQIQRELGGELGAKASILSTSSAGNISQRSFGNSSVLDITTTVASDLKDIVCQSMLCVMKDFTVSESQTNEGITQRQATKIAFETALSPHSGVNNENIRKNKTIECLKNIFSHRAVMSVAPAATQDPQSSAKELARLCSTIKRKAVPKQVCGKAINGNMFLALSLEYAETLSQPMQGALTLPGAKSSTMHSLILLFQAFSRVSEEETLRIADTVLAEFQDELNLQVNQDTMPLAEKTLKKTFKKLEQKYRSRLRQDLAEIATFDEVMYESDKIDERMRQCFEAKSQENYSQGYYFAVGLLQQLYNQHFLNRSSDKEAGSSLTAAEFKQKWADFADDYQNNGGEDSQAKWDVFAECFHRFPIEEKSRFVDYSKVECEQVVDLADETDTLNNPSENRNQGTIPQELLNDQIQIMSLIESQIEDLKQRLLVELTESEVSAQKVFQNHQELDQAKQENEIKMEELKRSGDELAQQKNDMELQIQAVDRQRAELEAEQESLSAVTGSEHLKHRAQLDQKGSVQDQELAEHNHKAEELKSQLAGLDEQLMREEQEMRADLQQLEAEIQTRRDEQDQMDQALAQRDQSALLQQVNQFLGHEVPEQYLAQIKDVFQGNSQEAKDLKLQLFEEQKKLNDVDYHNTQEQLQMKQKLDDDFITCRHKKDKELQEAQTRFESVRRKHMELSQKKETVNEQLQAAMRLLEERQEQLIGLNEKKDAISQQLDEDVSKIVAGKATLTEGGDNMENLEHQIYELSVQNRNQLGLKERLIELISEITRSTQRGKPTPELLAILQSLPNNRNKSRLDAILLPKPGAVN